MVKMASLNSKNLIFRDTLTTSTRKLARLRCLEREWGWRLARGPYLEDRFSKIKIEVERLDSDDCVG